MRPSSLAMLSISSDGLFGISKKTFKKAVGDLYKKRLITVDEDGLTLVR